MPSDHIAFQGLHYPSKLFQPQIITNSVKSFYLYTKYQIIANNIKIPYKYELHL